MKKLCISILSLVLLVGCVTAPAPGELDHLTRVPYGDPLPADEDYVLYFEAGQEIPVNILIEGDFLGKGVNQQHTVTLKKSVYAYKEWVSYDGTHWFSSDEFLDISLHLIIPGYNHPNQGLIHLKVDEQS